jgi:hypothetical protein
MKEILHHLEWLKPYKIWDKPSTGAEFLPSIIFYHFSSFHPGVFTWITYQAVPPKTLNHTLTLHLVLWFMAAKTEGWPEWPELPSIKSDFGWLCLHGMGQGYHHVPPVADYTLNPNVRNGFCLDFVTFHQGHARWNNFKPLWFTTCSCGLNHNSCWLIPDFWLVMSFFVA